jgi:hypothetical protein
MNCHAAQKKITDALAANVAPPSGAASHAADCAKCQAFYEKQRRLFASIDVGVQNAVNQPVPLSLLLHLRVQLDQAPARRSLWTPRWTYAAVAAVVVLALMGVASRNRFLRRDASSEPNHIVARSDRQPVHETPPISSEVTTPRAALVRSNKKGSPAAIQRPEAVPEVIVLAEEREALTRFISQVLSNAGVAPAPKPDVGELSDALVDVALIEIQDVEITPLASMNGDGQ